MSNSQSPAGRPRRPGLIVLSLFTFLAIAAAGLAFVLISSSTAKADYGPVVTASALRDWEPLWPAGEEATFGADVPAEVSGTDSTDGAAVAAEAQDTAGDSGVCGAMPERWWVIGWDGADWDLILPLLEAGKMPHFESLMRRGSYGTLHSMLPTLSPAIWTTVATGVGPDSHGILHFYNQPPLAERLIERATNFGELKRQLYSNADRTAPAIWNELSARDRDVLVVGYHNTFPVEKVNGTMVSNYLMQDSVADVMDMDVEGDDAGGTANLGGSLVYPPERLQEVLDIQRRVKRRTPEIVQRFADIPEEDVDRFLRLSQRLDVDDQKPYYLVHSWLFDTIAAETAEAMLARHQPALTMVHFQGVDWASHRFYYYRDPSLFAEMDWSTEQRQELDADIPLYRKTVDAFYIYLDEWLGRLLALRQPGTAVMLLSDHGFEIDSDPDITGAHYNAPPGVVVLEGPGIERNHRLEPHDVYDILPTLMAGLQEPVAQDLPGDIMREAFCAPAWESAEHQTVASYASGIPFAPDIIRSDSLDAAVLEQLESLGYLD
ncbi:MAG: alkaline phosphatase family protein [Acidobacteriota bacterium]